MKKNIFIVGLALLALSAAASAVQPIVKDISFQQVGDSVRLVIGMTQNVEPKISYLVDPDRMVIDVSGAVLKSNPPTIPPAASSFIKAVRGGYFDPTTVRIVIDFDDRTMARDHWLSPDSNTGYKFTIDFKSTARVLPQPRAAERYSSAPRPPAVRPSAPRQPQPAAYSPIVDRSQNVATPVYTNNNGYAPNSANNGYAARPQRDYYGTDYARPAVRDVFANGQLNSQPGRDLIIAIDPGHGGKDTGAVGLNGTCEKDVVLSIGRRLAMQINSTPGMRAVLTRSDDIFIPLRERVAIARSARADLFISIHADAAYNRAAQGASVYTLSERGASSEAAKLLANKENAADLVGGVSYSGDDLLTITLLDMSLSATMEASRNVAEHVLDRLYQVG
ncbi:hypothetical protein TI04_12085, partial [Achromatium sp. WMS2]